MSKGEKRKLWVGLSLMAVAGVSLALAFRPSNPSTVQARPTQGRGAALQTLTSTPTAGAGGAARRARSAAGMAVDPVLRLDLLAKVQDVQYEGTERNIFQFYTPPPPPPPKPVAPAGTAQTGGAPPAPPPPPPIPLKFYGFASSPGETPKRAFLADTEDIYIAAEGEVVKKRYKVLRIGPNSIEMEDMQTNSKQRLPLQET